MSDLELRSLYQAAQDALGRGDNTGAAGIAERMLELRRNEVNALRILADAANRTWQPDRAAEYMTRVVRVAPKSAEFRVELAGLHAALRQYPRALEQYDKAMKLAPGMPSALAGKAMVYILQGKYDRARRVLKPVLAGGSVAPELAAPALRVLLRDGDLAAAIDLGERVVATAPPPNMALRDVCFELARAYERDGRYEEAFAAAERGNAILAPSFDIDGYTRRVDRFIATYTRELLASLPRPAEPSELPVFIVGMPRCGSTLVERILHAHPDAHGAGELNLVFRITAELPMMLGSESGYPECVADLDQPHVDEASARYLDALRAHAPAAPRIVDKELTNHEHVGLLGVLFPRGHVIHCRRDPVDNCLSCYMERLAPDNARYATDLRHLGQFHRQYERLMEHWREVLDHPPLEVEYEALTADPEDQTRRILEFCDLPWDDACLSFHRVKRAEQTLSTDQVRKPIYRSSVGRAERFGPLLDPLREALEQDPGQKP
ncbi:MAG: tetratricopeptide repeat protein [Planctomycetes bacterium]|nr:tetratricopeptide repeat protein [Planctomycetota bacterium]